MRWTNSRPGSANQADRRTGRGVGLLLAAGILLALGAAGAAHAQTNCGALILPSPNLGQNPPGDVLDPGEIVSINIDILNTCLIAGVDVPAQIRGITTITLACADAQPCTIPLLGTFANVMCSPAPDVACAVDPNQNVVRLTYTGPGAAKSLPAFPTFTTLATITAQAQPGGQAATTPDGQLNVDAVTLPGDVFTALASGSGSGSAPLFYPGACNLQMDRQVSCDGGVSFVDVRGTDDLGNAFVRTCAAAQSGTVVVRNVARNAGVADLASCQLVDGNALLGASQSLGNIGVGSGDLAVTKSALCKDVVGGEPALATVTCQCNGVLGQFPISDQDTASFSCITVTVPATTPWGSALLGAMLLGALSLWTVRRSGTLGL